MQISRKKIICAVDFSATSDSVVRYAASTFNGHVELTLLYVAPEENNHDSFLRKHLHEFSRYSDMLSQSKVDTIFTVQYGNPATEILVYAKEHNADIILLGSHGTTAIARLLVGGTAESVMRQAPCPVLILKMPQQQR
jgi:nucleotide-binding universal stress UspA family protein